MADIASDDAVDALSTPVRDVWGNEGIENVWKMDVKGIARK